MTNPPESRCYYFRLSSSKVTSSHWNELKVRLALRVEQPLNGDRYRRAGARRMREGGRIPVRGKKENEQA